MAKYYATLCLKDGNHYITIHAATRLEAREKMFASAYGNQWAFLYDETEKPAAIDAFCCTELQVIS